MVLLRNTAVYVWLLFFLLLFLKPCVQDLQSGVLLVTSVSNSFVPKLFQALAPGRENLVFAPFGLVSNLGMLLEGSDGKTAQEIIKGLNISPGSREELRVGFKAYFDSFESAAANEEAAGAFNMAMLRSSGALSPSYKAVLSHYYRANITENADFDQRSGVQVLELRSDSGVMSHWKDYHRLAAFAFLSHVASAPFFRSARETVSVPMVPQVGIFRSGRIEHLLCHAIQLPLEVDTVNLLLLLPDSSDHLDELIVKLTDISLQQIVDSLEYRETEVSLPQLAVLTSGLDLTPFLRQLGVKSVFNSSGVGLKQASSPNNTLIYVRSVTQDAYFSTSFVAVNSVGSISSNVVSRRLKRDTSTLIFDRPFLFFLLHRDTQLVLLAGKVQNPTQVP